LIKSTRRTQYCFLSILFLVQQKLVIYSTRNMMFLIGLLIWHQLSLMVGFSAATTDVRDSGDCDHPTCEGITCARACNVLGCGQSCRCTKSCSLYCPNGDCIACCSCYKEVYVGVGDVVAAKFDHSVYVVNKSHVPADSKSFWWNESESLPSSTFHEVISLPDSVSRACNQQSLSLYLTSLY
jgi:hypothetical protein